MRATKGDQAGQAIITEADFAARALEMMAENRAKTAASDEARKNHGFTQVYQHGWTMMESLVERSPAASKLYLLLARNIDAKFGCVVASQEWLAEQLDITSRQLRVHIATLERMSAVVRFRAGGSTAYCLNPQQVWRGTDDGKDLAAFHTNVMLSKNEKRAFSVKVLGALGKRPSTTSAHQQMEKAASRKARKAKQAPAEPAMADPNQLSLL
ncbi:MAG TPA: hypothetical protein HPQ04_00995 [Rhodospirillaceae bacterium]|nr:hypothetical protein [Rhodospirillaceae bacterium]